jgi:uncharacterized protein (DUF1778 family)
MSVSKSGRVSARVPSHVYTMLTEAAELSGATLNQFLVQSAFEKAQLIIEQEQIMNLPLYFLMLSRSLRHQGKN